MALPLSLIHFVYPIARLSENSNNVWFALQSSRDKSVGQQFTEKKVKTTVTGLTVYRR